MENEKTITPLVIIYNKQKLVFKRETETNSKGLKMSEKAFVYLGKDRSGKDKEFYFTNGNIPYYLNAEKQIYEH